MTAQKKICVIGNPISHSRSPLIHNYWIKQHELEAQYQREEISSEELPEFLRTLSSHGYIGANITIPHKQAAYENVEIADENAKRLKAVNTIYFQNGKLCGTNTDGEGFLENLKHQVPSWRAKTGPALILGAGGAARAIIGALLDEGVEKIFLVNRTIEKAQELADQFGPTIIPLRWDQLEEKLPQARLLVNTTSLGMTGKPPLELDISQLAKGAIVADIVYAPLETDLLRVAKQRGHETVDGLGMLLHQAVRGFELWFDIKPEVTPQLRNLIIADLEKA